MNLDETDEFQTKDSLYLKADDVEGKRFQLQIANVATDTFSRPDEDDETKLVLKFVDKEKGIVLNWSNLKRLKRAWGPETDDWVGKTVDIETTFWEQFGKNGFVVRPYEDATPADEIPF